MKKTSVTPACSSCQWLMKLESGLACYRQDVDEKECNFVKENFDDPDLTWDSKPIPIHKSTLMGKEKQDIVPIILLIMMVTSFILVAIFIH